jgi:hypothetical protein
MDFPEAVIRSGGFGSIPDCQQPFTISLPPRPSSVKYRRISCEISLAIHCAIVARFALRDNLTLNDRNHRLRVVYEFGRFLPGWA